MASRKRHDQNKYLELDFSWNVDVKQMNFSMDGNKIAYVMKPVSMMNRPIRVPSKYLKFYLSGYRLCKYCTPCCLSDPALESTLRSTTFRFPWLLKTTFERFRFCFLVRCTVCQDNILYSLRTLGNERAHRES